ncbi:MAG: FimV/HubP family polar landmark protein [Polaromonas sp.]
MKNSPRWRIGVLASAVALLGSLASLEAHALALGRITVQSALGEPLRAEVDIADINPEEAASLKAGVASQETFKAAGLEYNAVVAAGLEVRLQRRSDGRAYLRLTSSRPVTEPFVDLIIEANWASGRVSRDYTMLLDPPNLRSRATVVEPNAPLLSQPVPSAAPVARPQARAPYSPPAAALRPAPPAPPSPSKVQAAKVPEGDPMPAGDKRLTVRSGDTAGRIASVNKPSSVSLDQMLVALLRSNPDAFIGGNINRIKSGAVLDIPGTQAASAISASEATQTILAQSKDFNTFRRKLAINAPTTQIDNADRQAGGKVQAKVDDSAPASATPDKLTLSKGQIQGKAAAANEEKIATDKEAKASASRIAELSRNIAELNKLNAAPGAVTAAAGQSPVTAGSAATVPAGLAISGPAPAVAASSSPQASQSAPDTAESSAAKAATTSAALPGTAPLAAASQPGATPKPAATASATKPLAPLVTPASEPGFVDQLLENPLLLPGIAALLALLAGFGFYRYRQNNKKGQVDSSFLESRLQPDSFFGASGGQRIDTGESNVTGSSMAYTSSQLDAAGDVDPVAEADVYLAYGRDLQAEEILKEALRSHPARVAIHAKLLEIYAKRQDTKAFEGVAIDAFKLTQGYGPEWAYIAEAGRGLDPANRMYQATGIPAANPRIREAPIAATLATAGVTAEVAPPPLHAVDLDLDFSLDDQPEVSTAPADISVMSPYDQPAVAPASVRPTPLAASLGDLDLDLDLGFGKATAALPGDAAATHPLLAQAPASEDIDFAPHGMDFTPESFTAPLPLTTSGAHPAPLADSGMLEFDMSSLSLDLEPTTQATDPAVDNSQDPLEVKFLLAEEFRALGDSDGARSLADEVLDNASGPLKAKAQAFLNTLA